MKQSNLGQFFTVPDIPKPEYTVYFDGCCKGNPGRAGCGAVLYDARGNEIDAQFRFVGEKETNNVAEYSGVLLALSMALDRGNIRSITVRGDSELVIKQLLGQYRTKNSKMAEYAARVKKLEREFDYVCYQHVRRGENARADQLANLGAEAL